MASLIKDQMRFAYNALTQLVIPDCLKKEYQSRNIPLPDISTFFSKESTTTTPPNDSNLSSDNSDSSTTISSNPASNDSDSNSTSNESANTSEPSDESARTFEFLGMKLTFDEIESLSPEMQNIFRRTNAIYEKMTGNSAHKWSFCEKEERMKCDKVPVPGVKVPNISVYEPILQLMESQKLLQNKVVMAHFKDPLYVMVVNFYFEERGLIGLPHLLLGDLSEEDLLLVEFIIFLKGTFPVTKLQDYLNHHTIEEILKWVKSITSTTTSMIGFILADADPFPKEGSFASDLVKKLLKKDPAFKQFLDNYFSMVMEYQTLVWPISSRIISDMIQKKKVGTEEKEESEVKFVMIDFQSKNYEKFFAECCEKTTSMITSTSEFMNECGEMKTVMSILDLYHLATQNNRTDGACTGLMTQEQYFRALHVLVSILSIVHQQNIEDIFKKSEQFKLAELLKDAGVAGIKGREPTLMSNEALLKEYLEAEEEKRIKAEKERIKAEKKRLKAEKKRSITDFEKKQITPEEKKRIIAEVAEQQRLEVEEKKRLEAEEKIAWAEISSMTQIAKDVDFDICKPPTTQIVQAGTKVSGMKRGREEFLGSSTVNDLHMQPAPYMMYPSQMHMGMVMGMYGHPMYGYWNGYTAWNGRGSTPSVSNSHAFQSNPIGLPPSVAKAVASLKDEKLNGIVGPGTDLHQKRKALELEQETDEEDKLEYTDMTVKELKEILKERKQPVCGLKAELIFRCENSNKEESCLYKWNILIPASCFHDSMLVVITIVILDTFCKE